MKVNLEEVKQVAKLAKINLTQEEAEGFFQELNQVFDWVNQLEQLCLQDHHQHPKLSCPMVEDTPNAPVDVEKLLSNAPKHHQGYFVVPNVLSGDA
ncbi:aspartyl/glutamyl-tRNA(Asn/Gln) amidotransferase subunit C [Holospora obtusa F1]|uniref:Aspartyl/glutamyl-tRNA(Asn/Gln) amidotransferase subunit C n=1 Tax=Holospora obtusa F1 TaxID=1399147 RepID=W6TSH3_HOLOB|nr:Asp-tRNA(Asn)/Glu-tRNA(Gln) amidotransferase subunit GatC [Holospora obtusa]ETZ06767.1 aspartyl/glutamyl-tRNA(Asn/Gln) amidotransferase subunit C [Holospora obtusa F1]